jgi:hypothetical protein
VAIPESDRSQRLQPRKAPDVTWSPAATYAERA